jgi:hypothetical protein
MAQDSGVGGSSNHMLQDVSSKRYDCRNYMPEKREGLARWTRFVGEILNRGALKSVAEPLVRARLVLSPKSYLPIELSRKLRNHPRFSGGMYGVPLSTIVPGCSRSKIQYRLEKRQRVIRNAGALVHNWIGRASLHSRNSRNRTLLDNDLASAA